MKKELTALKHYTFSLSTLKDEIVGIIFVVVLMRISFEKQQMPL